MWSEMGLGMGIGCASRQLLSRPRVLPRKPGLGVPWLVRHCGWQSGEALALAQLEARCEKLRGMKQHLYGVLCGLRYLHPSWLLVLRMVVAYSLGIQAIQGEKQPAHLAKAKAGQHVGHAKGR